MRIPLTLHSDTLQKKLKSKRFLKDIRAIVSGVTCDKSLREDVPNAFDVMNDGSPMLFGVPYFVRNSHPSDLCTVIMWHSRS